MRTLLVPYYATFASKTYQSLAHKYRTHFKGVQGFWLKKLLTSLHDRIAEQLDHVLNGRRGSQSGWRWATNFVFKDPAKGNTVDNYRPVSCLPHMWKLSTAVVPESMYNYLDKNKLLPEEQKVCRKGIKRKKNCWVMLWFCKTVRRDTKWHQRHQWHEWITGKLPAWFHTVG